MSGVADWLAMGGYAAFVWPCYVLAAILLVGMAAQAYARLAAAERALGRQGTRGESDTDQPR